MRKTIVIAAIFFTLIFVFETHAEENTIRLVCKYSHTIDADGASSETSGEDLVTINYLDNGQAIIKKQGLGAEFIGKISEEEIKGDTEYEISNLKVQQSILVNRYTGSFEITFRTVGSKGGLIHYGTCEAVSKKKF